MGIIEPVIRPPSEAGSFLLQLTLGCSENHCSFCGAYKTKSFRIKDRDEVFGDIERFSSQYPETRRVFLMDGDALVLSNSKLVPVLRKLNECFPKLSRISSYANGTNIMRKSDAELAELSSHKLTLIYMGLESGSQSILDRCTKSSGVRQMIEAVRRAEKARIRSSVIVLLGLGGKKHSGEHVRGTIEALNLMQPRYLSFLSLMVIPGTPLSSEVRRGDFRELNAEELLREACEIVRGLELKRTVFRSDHASNYLALEGIFPRDKSALLARLEAALGGNVRLRPEYSRGL
ncbi:MAG: coproporphyrinogen III oxidase [Candidatus Omnitrophica bacterium ADurb.Bin277]|nr:MAG: coproporphyrinogen III oxidase [Candidatus Omnitrophica bacterium ADurb.Bin277]